MKSIITTFIFSIMTLFSFAQLSAGDNVYLQFQDTDGEVNVDGDDACEMLKSYVIGKTSLSVVSNKEESDYTLVLYVIEKNMGDRKGKIDVLDSKIVSPVLLSTTSIFPFLSPKFFSITYSTSV